jgi:NAD(P)-dependent dehydrogenase (short-subunit alcohol dehydrogenase family)
MPNTYDLDGRTAIVTEGAKGIGRAIACRLLGAGATVWTWDLVDAGPHGARTVVWT